jgi:hypothetical protein
VRDGEWPAATQESLYKGNANAGALEHSAAALRRLWSSLDTADLTSIAEGRLQ